MRGMTGEIEKRIMCRLNRLKTYIYIQDTAKPGSNAKMHIYNQKNNNYN